MTEAELNAVATALGLILDEMQARDGQGVDLLRQGVAAIGDMLAERGGIMAMSTVMEAVLDQRPDAESWREGVVDSAWSGFGGWAS